MIGISFHSAGFANEPLPWVIEHLAGIGYDAIEIVCGPEAHIRTGDPLGPQLGRAKAALAENGLGVAAINPYTQPALANFAQENLQGAIDRWSLLIDIAEELGSKNVNFLPGWLPDGDRVAWEAAIAALRELTKYGEEKGVTLAIHNHEGQIIDSPDKCLRLIDEIGSPNLGVLCDITNFYILGADIAEAVHRVGPHIVHCHVKGVIGKYPSARFIVPGEEGDEMPFGPFATALGDVDYDQCVSVEVFPFMRQDKAEIGYELFSSGLGERGLR